MNELTALKCNKRAILTPLTLTIAPYAPHIAEELWALLGHTGSIQEARFPAYDEQFLQEDAHEYPVSFNGKMRVKLSLSLGLTKAEIEEAVLADEAVQRILEGKAPKKVIVVPGKIVNLVV
ncbi:leucyl-tRNA ligase [Nitritalea halalkaliphila LW7]|uniref:leucine--tRNA ligase n=1 Tax=Nitritalea halalkaliphila LW7 TaxID=1189621 RepID=I5BY39_9BACT|nr:leucyl-tRNA ligase [Nitritalea halalkaliphila LW7]